MRYYVQREELLLMDMKMRIAKLVCAALKDAFDADEPAAPAVSDMLEIPPEPGLGDYAFPCFKLAKTLRKGPPQIAAALSDAFDVDCAGGYNDIVARVGLDPISPRFLRERAFDVFYLNSEKGAIGMSIHEIIHFVWFDVWHSLFGDSFDEYERPNLKWILSEMVVESVMSDPRLSSINPYFPREEGGCIYPYFFDMKAGGELILGTLDKMYRSENIRDFMRDSYAYCLEHEQEIRSHIEKSEANYP